MSGTDIDNMGDDGGVTPSSCATEGCGCIVGFTLFWIGLLIVGTFLGMIR